MPAFGRRSRSNLDKADSDLQSLFEAVVKIFDCSILESHRSKERQTEMFEQGKSKVNWPNGKHNSFPSKAVDVAPYPIDWNDKARFYYLAGIVKGIASKMGFKIRWGGDWDGDNSFKDQRFDDLPHFEILD